MQVMTASPLSMLVLASRWKEYHVDRGMGSGNCRCFHFTQHRLICFEYQNQMNVLEFFPFVCYETVFLSIGSLGKDNSTGIVTKVVLDTAFLRETTNGVRIKTWQVSITASITIWIWILHGWLYKTHNGKIALFVWCRGVLDMFVACDSKMWEWKMLRIPSSLINSIVTLLLPVKLRYTILKIHI